MAASVVEAVCAQLPALRRPGQALVERFRDSGPPAEDVGLEPFAPPGTWQERRSPDERHQRLAGLRVGGATQPAGTENARSPARPAVIRPGEP